MIKKEKGLIDIYRATEREAKMDIEKQRGVENERRKGRK